VDDTLVGGELAFFDAPVNGEVEGGTKVMDEMVDNPNVCGEEVDEAPVHDELEEDVVVFGEVVPDCTARYRHSTRQGAP
jgi:hypothetical protein